MGFFTEKKEIAKITKQLFQTSLFCNRPISVASIFHCPVAVGAIKQTAKMKYVVFLQELRNSRQIKSKKLQQKNQHF